MSIRLGSINLTGGSPGKSAYNYAQEGGYTGTEEQFYTDLANPSSAIKVTNVALATSNFVSDSTYSDYAYRGSAAITGVTSDMTPTVTFSMTDAVSGNYSPIAETYNGGVYIYAKVNTAITIESILCV